MGASWQAFYAHLCAASIIRAMPETEIPPAMRGDLYYSIEEKCVYPKKFSTERITKEKVSIRRRILPGKRTE